MTIAQVGPMRTILSRINMLATSADEELRLVHDALVASELPVALDLAAKLVERVGPAMKGIIMESTSCALERATEEANPYAGRPR